MTKTIYAGFWIRSVAWLLDALILNVPYYAILWFAFQEYFINVMFSGEFSLSHTTISLGLAVAYFVGFWGWKSATPGKMIVGIKIVNAGTLSKPSLGACFGRYVSYLVSAIPFCLGFLWVAWGKNKRGWHDKLAGTAVIYPRRLETADPIPSEVDTVNEVDTRGSGSIKRILISIAVIIAIFLGGLHWYDPLLVSEFFPITHESKSGGDYDKGLAAYQSGDYATALREWTPLAEQGHVDAQLNLGRMYYKGQGVPQDEKTAGKWITLAAEQGHVSAQAILSTLYASGRGVIRDYVYAHMWGSIAVSRGLSAELHSLIMTLMPVVAEDMTPTQIAKAEKLASECIAKKYKGCQSTTTGRQVSGVIESSLPPCKETSTVYFHNCHSAIFRSDGSTYDGEWQNGRYHGYGTKTYPGGTKYIGEWKKGKQWEGTQYDEDGDVFSTYSEGVWKMVD